MMQAPEKSLPQPNTKSALDQGEGLFRQGLIEVIPALRAFARSLCGKRDVADDLVQETLMKAWQSRDRFQAGTNLKAWIFVILRNEFYSTLRRAKTVTKYVDTESLKPEGVEAGQDAQMNLTDLMRAFNELAPEQKEALILIVGDFSYEEAASICGCAVGTIKSRVSRARKNLEQLVEGRAGKLPDRTDTREDAMNTFFKKLNDTTVEKPLR
jgi:RNA polymerase sigma-70 factor (ECF subfamily)